MIATISRNRAMSSFLPLRSCRILTLRYFATLRLCVKSLFQDASSRQDAKSQRKTAKKDTTTLEPRFPGINVVMASRLAVEASARVWLAVWAPLWQ